MVEKILHDLDPALGGLQDLKALQKGVVRTAGPQLMACTLLPDVMAAFGTAHPGVQVRLADCAVESMLARVGAGEADLGIGPERSTGPGIAVQDLFEMPLMVVFPRGHALETLTDIGWSDMREHPFIALQGSSPSASRWTCTGHCTDSPCVQHTKCASRPRHWAWSALARASRVCLPCAASMVRLHGLRMRPLHTPQLRCTFQGYRRASAWLSPAVPSFMEFLAALVASNGWDTGTNSSSGGIGSG